MQLEHEWAVVFALWQDGLRSDREVIAWADGVVTRLAPEKIPDWLFELSLHGPRVAQKNPELRLPASACLTFADRFALRAVRLDLQVEKDVEKFATWAAAAAMGEDASPEVELAYMLDHYIHDCDDMARAVATVRFRLRDLLPALATRASALSDPCQP